MFPLDTFLGVNLVGQSTYYIISLPTRSGPAFQWVLSSCIFDYTRYHSSFHFLKIIFLILVKSGKSDTLLYIVCIFLIRNRIEYILNCICLCAPSICPVQNDCFCPLSPSSFPQCCSYYLKQFFLTREGQ